MTKKQGTCFPLGMKRLYFLQIRILWEVSNNTLIWYYGHWENFRKVLVKTSKWNKPWSTNKVMKGPPCFQYHAEHVLARKQLICSCSMDFYIKGERKHHWYNGKHKISLWFWCDIEKNIHERWIIVLRPKNTWMAQMYKGNFVVCRLLAYKFQFLSQ